MPDGFVVFDDVFVPDEHVFLDGETANAAVFAHSLGLWERLGGVTAMVTQADELVGWPSSSPRPTASPGCRTSARRSTR